MKQPRALFNDILYHKTAEPGANSAGRGRFQRKAACVRVSLSAPVNEETQTHPSTGTKHRASTLHSFHNVIFVLGQHSHSGLWSRLELMCNVVLW